MTLLTILLLIVLLLSPVIFDIPLLSLGPPRKPRPPTVRIRTLMLIILAVALLLAIYCPLLSRPDGLFSLSWG